MASFSRDHKRWLGYFTILSRKVVDLFAILFVYLQFCQTDANWEFSREKLENKQKLLKSARKILGTLKIKTKVKNWNLKLWKLWKKSWKMCFSGNNWKWFRRQKPLEVLRDFPSLNWIAVDDYLWKEFWQLLRRYTLLISMIDIKQFFQRRHLGKTNNSLSYQRRFLHHLLHRFFWEISAFWLDLP